MDIKHIRALARLLQETGLTALEIEEGETRIRLERSDIQRQMVVPAPGTEAFFPRPEDGHPGDDPGMDFNNIGIVQSTMVGVFYAAPGPGREPFVKVGSKVKQGDVLCILEAMKLMNEITAETEGEIVDICVKDGDVVEFGQTLFKIF